MARLARIVIPGLAHHVTQRGNRREAIFFEDGDHEVYLDLLAEQTFKAGVALQVLAMWDTTKARPPADRNPAKTVNPSTPLRPPSNPTQPTRSNRDRKSQKSSKPLHINSPTRPQ